MAAVYPHITINDTEEASLLQLDATNNTVLIPVPFAKRYYLENQEGTAEKKVVWDPHENWKENKAILYMGAQEFMADWGDGAGEWNIEKDPITETIVWKEPKNKIPRYCFDFNIKWGKDSGTIVDQNKYAVIYTPERAYLMVIELLKRGLPVLVKPIPVEYGTSIVHDEDDKGIITVEPNEEFRIVDNTATLSQWGRDDIVIDTTENIVFGYHSAFTNEVLEAIKGQDGKSAFSDLVDKNLYKIKFITSGGYPNIGSKEGEDFKDPDDSYDAYDSLTELAVKRGDCIAILDHREDIYNKQDFESWISNLETNVTKLDYNKYKLAAAFTPWCEFSIEKRLPHKDKSKAKKFNLSPIITMSGGFAYLMAYAYSIQTNETWFAASGVMRGQIPQMVKPLFDIGESFMELLQGKYEGESIPKYKAIRINPIMDTGSYGYRIWGNRVAAPFTDAAGLYKAMFSEFLNVRVLLCDIKKQIYAAAMRTTFEPNDDITWVNFKVLCNSLLDRMKSGRGVLWYRWHKEVAEERATIKARLTIRPVEAVEAFDITVFLTDQDAEVEE